MLVTCETCGGEGTVDYICSACNGSGEGMYDGSTCWVCGGSGGDLDRTCGTCRGEGVIEEDSN